MASLRESNQNPSTFRLAVPSDGAMYEPTLGFLRACGMPVKRPSERGYVGCISGMEEVTVLFQRVADITGKVEEGSADLGIVGLDRFREYGHLDGDTVLLVEDLGFSQCQLVIAVPDTWMDVTAVSDLADLAVEFRDSGRELRVATKYPGLVQRFLFHRGINYFSMVQASGTLEAAPLMGYADIIGDISATGTTLRENRLKTLEDGAILTSQACLIGNRSLLGHDDVRMDIARRILERIEAYLNAGDFYVVMANVKGSSEQEVVEEILKRPDLAGLHGPVVCRIHTSDSSNWYSVTVVIHKRLLMDAVDHFRATGGSVATISQARYIFRDESRAYTQLLSALGNELA